MVWTSTSSKVVECPFNCPNLCSRFIGHTRGGGRSTTDRTVAVGVHRCS